MSDVRTLHSNKAEACFFAFLRWFDSWAGLEYMKTDGVPKMDWVRCFPLIAVHLMCLGIIWVGWSWTAVAVAVFFYYLRMFAITGFYHRYFSHRTFRTSRAMQFVFALAWLADTPEFNEAFGFPGFEQAPAFLLFALLSGTVTFWLSPLTNLLSRRHEFQADAYARAQASGADLSSALLKLHEDNAGTLTPDPVYARFYYSHPPAAERLAALAS